MCLELAVLSLLGHHGTLTFLWPGVVLPKGMVFVSVGVQVLQGILWDILSSHHFVIADNVGESNR